MQPSPNFGFLDAHAQLVRLGTLAERSFRDDTNVTLIKLRQFGEAMAQTIASRLREYRDPRENQKDLLERLEDRGAIPRDAARLFHEIRIVGNKAVHDGYADQTAALNALKMAWQLGVWFHRSYGGNKTFQPKPFAPPADPQRASAVLAAELERLRQQHAESLSAAERAQIAAQEAEQARLTAEERIRQEAEEKAALRKLLEDAEAKQAALVQELQAAQAAAPTAPATIEQVVEAAKVAAAAIDLDEAATRSIIDRQLRDRGWDADSQTLTYKSGARPAKNKAMAIAEWPTEDGRADYALFIDTTCIGVIEAKRKRKNVSASIDQAERYAKGFKPVAGVDLDGPWGDYRIPFVFATNGREYLKQIETESGIWFRDTRKSTNRRRALVDWPTPEGLRGQLPMDRDAAHATLKSMPMDFGFDLRPYQRKAIEKVEEALADDQRQMLVAMATGTGKTKLAIAMLSRLLESKRFRRVCFVVDRNILGKQTGDEFKTTKVVGVRTFAEIFGVKGLEDIDPEAETKVHICTIQALARRVLGVDDPAASPPIDQYDLMVVDECHRGYLLDRELSDSELEFRDQADYISKYRRVLEHFDAVKIGLTATPALHTVDIFGNPIFTYSYREAVVDGFLIDHEPPIRIETALSQAGINWQKGEKLDLLNTTDGTIHSTFAPDELSYEIEQFNRRVITREFNRVVAKALARYIDPSLPDKTLIFAVSDAHADMVVEEVKAAFEEAYGSIDDADVKKITGSVDKPRNLTLSFRNDPQPKIVVTVDLLTTGVDIPKITNLVFLRRVNSRILYEQMLGRATRKCDEIGKEVFRIFDAVDLYATLQDMTDMKPVGVEPKVTFEKLIAELVTVTDDRHREAVRAQIETKLKRRARLLSDEGRRMYEQAAGEPPEATVKRLSDATAGELAAWFKDRPKLGPILDWRPDRPGDPIPISDHADHLISAETVFGDQWQRPEDYLDAFAAWVRDNVNKVAALSIVVTRPRDLTREDLRQIRLILDGQKFTEAALHRAWEKAKSEDIAASIIGYVRQAALGDPLRPYADRVKDAMARILKGHTWTPVQQKWLKRIGDDVAKEVVVDRDFFESSQYKQDGGFERLNKVFGGRLEAILGDIREDIWRATA
ncbi:MAG: type I restriction enzyme, R subunit [Stygiobacter sp.]|nr:MAG: type I restriction enzyme, R subunit [Stygiobacter sp.]